MRIHSLAVAIAALALSLVSANAGANAPPIVSNVVSHQRTGTHLVDVTFDLADADAEPCTITAFLSTDGGATYPLALTTVSGSFGSGVMPGNGRSFVWNAGVDRPNFSGANCSIRVVADDGHPSAHMLVLYDRSGSMSTAAGGQSRYNAVRSALSPFFSDPAHAGLFVGLNFFPAPGFESSCSANPYNPAQVAFGELNAYAPTLTSEIDGRSPAGNAPTNPALDGSLTALAAIRAADPSEPCFAVLITDGPASTCDLSFTNMSSRASIGLAQGVKTYVIVLGGTNAAEYNQVANSGGTGSAFLTGSGGSMASEVAAAMAAIFAAEFGP